MTKVLYPGSFDPITLGHMNIIEQALYLYDEVIIAIMQNSEKKTSFFTMEERLEMISNLYKRIDNVNVIIGTGAAVDVALLYECKAIVRGIRSLTDYAKEVELNKINLDISNKKIRTTPLLADIEYQFLSSSIVKEVLRLDKDVSMYLHPNIEKKVLQKKREINHE